VAVYVGVMETCACFVVILDNCGSLFWGEEYVWLSVLG